MDACAHWALGILSQSLDEAVGVDNIDIEVVAGSAQVGLNVPNE